MYKEYIIGTVFGILLGTISMSMYIPDHIDVIQEDCEKYIRHRASTHPVFRISHPLDENLSNLFNIGDK